MSSYLAFFKMKIRTLVEYRVNFAMILISSVVPLFAVFFLWQEIYKGQGVIEGMSFKQIVTYYVLSSLFSALLSSDISWNVAEEIRSGAINNHILRPYSYTGLQFTMYLSDRVVLIVLLFLVFALSNLVLSHFLVPMASVVNMALLLVNLAFGTVLTFYVSMIIGLVAFYWEEIKGLFYFQALVLQLFSGSIIPLDWYPASIGNVLQYLPFAYMVYYPVRIYLGLVQGREILFNFLLMGIWIAVLHWVVKLMWNKGMKNYRGFGG